MQNELIKKIKSLANEKKAKKLTIAQFIERLCAFSDGSYTKGFLIMAADHKMNKTNNPLFGRVKKLSAWSFDTNGDYTRKVNLQRERENKEANFEALPTWGEKVNKIIFRHHKEHYKLYMNVFPASNIGNFVAFYVDGRLATAEEKAIIEQFTPDKGEGSGRQGTEKAIMIRRPSLNNVHVVSLCGERILITDNLMQLEESLQTASATA